ATRLRPPDFKNSLTTFSLNCLLYLLIKQNPLSWT
ncbi:hypothetical protein M2123_002232, partial [Polynucleobacter sphagniphilus]|nr:hypothetical protein [Polynucleobacter sphagniphilus]